MIAKISHVVSGVDAYKIGTPAFNIVGLPDMAMEEKELPGIAALQIATAMKHRVPDFM